VAGQEDKKQIPKVKFVGLAAAQTYQCLQGHRLELVGRSPQKRSGTEPVVLTQYRCPPQHCRNSPLRGDCTSNPEAGRTIRRGEHEELIEALRQRMATAEVLARAVFAFVTATRGQRLFPVGFLGDDGSLRRRALTAERQELIEQTYRSRRRALLLQDEPLRRRPETGALRDVPGQALEGHLQSARICHLNRRLFAQ
jgi:hypothetical protein